MNADRLIGQILADDVLTNGGVILVGKGTRITHEHLERFQKFGISLQDLRVECNTFEEYETEKMRLSVDQLRSLETAKAHIEDFVEFVRNREEIPVDMLERQIVPQIHELSDDTNFYTLLSTLKHQGYYIYKHCLGVSILARHMSSWLNMNEKDSDLLVASALLYDIGMVMLPKELIEKPALYTHEEMKIIQKHPLIGYDLLRKSPKIDPRVAKVALQHHERMDGSGYPNNLRKDEISIESRIIGMLDVYLAMTSRRSYRSAHPINIVLQMMQLEIAELFDSTYSVPFLHNMMKSQIGKEVVLSNGQKGKIVFVPQTQPMKPLVHTESGDMIDLQTQMDINIQAIIG